MNWVVAKVLEATWGEDPEVRAAWGRGCQPEPGGFYLVIWPGPSLDPELVALG